MVKHLHFASVFSFFNTVETLLNRDHKVVFCWFGGMFGWFLFTNDISEIFLFQNVPILLIKKPEAASEMSNPNVIKLPQF